MYWRRMRTQSEWNVQMVGRSGFSSFPAPRSAPRVLGTSSLTRSSISRAALLVKVTARMFPGAMPRAIMCAMRKVITRVLPVPAPARIRTGPLIVAAASRCWRLSVVRFTIARGVYWVTLVKQGEGRRNASTLQQELRLRILRLDPLQVFSKKRRHVLELGDVCRIDGHEQLVRFEAGAGDFRLRRAGRGGFDGLKCLGHRRRVVHHLEEMFHAEIVEHVEDARVGGDEADRVVLRRLVLGELEAHACQHAEEGAVHHQTLTEFPGATIVSAPAH